jgi:predicted dehydrogenase
VTSLTTDHRDWYFDVTKSGGYLIEQSVHNLDLCNWVIGSHPLRATGLGGIVLYKDQPPGRTIYDFGSLTYEYAKGVKMSFKQNVFHPRGMPNGGQYIYVYGTKGAVDLMGTTTMYPLEQGGRRRPCRAASGQPACAYCGVLCLCHQREKIPPILQSEPPQFLTAIRTRGDGERKDGALDDLGVKL